MYCFGVVQSIEIPWDVLRAHARSATSLSYAPYSGVRVGAAGVTSDGRIVEGANVENASYGLTLCAECSLVSDLIRQGGGRLVAVAIVAGDGEPIAPCGRCRQVLFEHGGNELVLDAGEGCDPLSMRELLPGAFGPSELDSRSDR